MLSEKIRALRLSRNWTVEKLADKLEMGKSAVSKYENGDATPRPDVLKNLAKVFGVSMSELMEDKAPRTTLLNTFDPKLFERNLEDARSLDETTKTLLTVIIAEFLEKKNLQEKVDAVQQKLVG